MKKISTLILSLLCVITSYAQQKTYKMSQDGAVYTTSTDTIVFSDYNKTKGKPLERSVKFNNDSYKFVVNQVVNGQFKDLRDSSGNTLIKISVKNGEEVVQINDRRKLTRKRTDKTIISYLDHGKDAAFAYYYDMDNERHVVVTVRDSTLSPLLIELIVLEQWAHERRAFSGTGNARKRNTILTSVGIGLALAAIRLGLKDDDL